MKALASALTVLWAGTAAAFGPTANPAEALDEAACVGLPLRTFVADDRPAAITHAGIIPRNGDMPSHCHVSLRVSSDVEIEIRLPVATWNHDLIFAAAEPRADFIRGAGIVWSAAASPDVARTLGRDIAEAYYGKVPSRVLGP